MQQRGLSRGRATRSLATEALSRNPSDEQIVKLRGLGFTNGLSRKLISDQQAFRIWVIDNSGSMMKNDGHRVIQTSGDGECRMISCTRWAELQQCVSYHAELAGALMAPTTFRLLNAGHSGMNEFSVSVSPASVSYPDKKDIQESVSVAINIMKVISPRGNTPLTHHVQKIQANIENMLTNQLKYGPLRVILATDGLPTDCQGMSSEESVSNFASALRSLQELPVWVTIRLCTDDKEVVDFYNSLDDDLELAVEVVEDIVDEAKRVHRYNRWLNYGLSLHRCREFGIGARILDIIDERTLTVGELHEMCVFLFGIENSDDVPHPGSNWGLFLKKIDDLQAQEPLQWNPIKGRMTPWINVKTLEKMYRVGKPKKIDILKRKARAKLIF